MIKKYGSLIRQIILNIKLIFKNRVNTHSVRVQFAGDAKL